MKKQSITLLLALLAFHITIATASEELASADFVLPYLRIVSPQDIGWTKEMGTLAVGNFGYVPWGRTLVGNLRFADPEDGCDIKWRPRASDEEEDPPILVAERGGCTFTQKAMKAQILGAKMLIVLDKVDEDTSFIMPIGDGNEKGVYIPTVLLNKKGSDILREEIKKETRIVEGTKVNNTVIGALYFHFPRGKQLYFEVWLSSNDPKSINFAKDLAQYVPRLGQNVIFSPYYSIWQSYSNEAAYTKVNCFSNGKYCAPDPDDAGPLTGADALEEDLKQLCVWIQGSAYWWNYYQYLDTACFSTTDMHKCSDEAIRRSGLSLSEITTCVEDSFATKGDRQSDNYLLKQNLDKSYQRNILVWPMVIINNFTYRGNIDPASEVFDALCEGFADANIPSTCIEWDSQKGMTDKTTKKGNSVVGPILLLLVVFGVFIAAFMTYRKWLRRSLMREMNTQMNVRISQYFSMAEKQ